MCFHTFLLTTAAIVATETLKLGAILAKDKPFWCCSRICLIFSGFNFANGCFSPIAPRPFSSLSFVLPAFVVINKWFGFIHSGLSHLCATTSEGNFKALMARCAISLCALQSTLFTFILPYPSLSTEPPQFQHPFSLIVNFMLSPFIYSPMVII